MAAAGRLHPAPGPDIRFIQNNCNEDTHLRHGSQHSLGGGRPEIMRDTR